MKRISGRRADRAGRLAAGTLLLLAGVGAEGCSEPQDNDTSTVAPTTTQVTTALDTETTKITGLNSSTTAEQTTSTEAGTKGTGLFPVRVGDEMGYIDRTGKTVITTQFAAVNSFSDGLASVYKNEEEASWSYIDKTGKVIWDGQ